MSFVVAAAWLPFECTVDVKPFLALGVSSEEKEVVWVEGVEVLRVMSTVVGYKEDQAV
jgi:hypothetical protein